MTNLVSYELEKSFFYRLRNRRKLAIFLGLENNFFNSLSYKNQVSYRLSQISKPDGKQRKIQEPQVILKRIQKKLLKYLSRIHTPEWLMSGKKGISYINNGLYHQDNQFIYTADIKSFYDNCKRHHIFGMFIRSFKMSRDIAGIITDLVAYEKCVPTGSPTSQIIAYWTYNRTFHNIAKISENYNCKFSLYVDDMTFSSQNPISSRMIFEIENELKKVGLGLKKSKSKYYPKNSCKLITGVVIDLKGNPRIPNRLRISIINDWKRIKDLNDGEEKNKKILSLKGKLVCARQIEPTVFQSIYNKLIKLQNV